MWVKLHDHAGLITHIRHHHQGSLSNEAVGLILFRVKFVAISQTGQHILASQGTLNFLKVEFGAGVKKSGGANRRPIKAAL